MAYVNDSDEEQEEEEDMLLACILVSEYLEEKEERAKFYVRERIVWEHHIAELTKEGDEAFQRLYRMDYSAFMKLCSIIQPQVQVNEEMSRRRTGKDPVSVEMMLHCLLHYLAGGSYLDLKISTGISRAAFYHYIYKCMDAIMDSTELAYKFPETAQELNEAAQGFEALSSHGAIKGCVACLDGYLLQIKVPAKSETGNVKAYFSGHYQTYGINVQAACDHKCRFVYAALAAPGGANDIAAYRKIDFSKMVQNLPIRKFVIGDNAYMCTETLLTPFSGKEKKDPEKDAFNFYLSQLRINSYESISLCLTVI